MNENSIGVIEELAVAYEKMAKALREIISIGITVPKEAVASQPENSISLEDVRGVLAEKSRMGFTQDIKEILKGFDAEKLSDVNPSDYALVLEKVRALSND